MVNGSAASLDGTYTRLLQAMRAQNLSWKNHPTKGEIYGELPPISKTVACAQSAKVRLHRRLQNCGSEKSKIRRPLLPAKDQVISDLLLQTYQDTRLERVSHASVLFHTLTRPNVRFTRLRPAFFSERLIK